MISNTASALYVWGDAAALGTNGSSYRIHNYRLGSSSPCIDSGKASPVSSSDLEGNFRPLGGGYDMGAFEYSPVGVDSDGDGLPDSWELSYVSALTNMSATSDSDLDGSSDFSEFSAGTVPIDDTSFLAVSAVLPPLTDRTPIRFQSVSGMVYRVQWTTNLLLPAWSDTRHATGQVSQMFTGSVTGLVASTEIYVDQSGNCDYYRITIE